MCGVGMTLEPADPGRADYCHVHGMKDSGAVQKVCSRPLLYPLALHPRSMGTRRRGATPRSCRVPPTRISKVDAQGFPGLDTPLGLDLPMIF